MNIYALVDNREVDGLEGAIFFKSKEDAEAMQRSMGSDEEQYRIKEFEVIF